MREIKFSKRIIPVDTHEDIKLDSKHHNFPKSICHNDIDYCR